MTVTTFSIDRGYDHRAELKELGLRYDKETKLWTTHDERAFLIAQIKMGWVKHPPTKAGKWVVQHSDPTEMRICEHRGLCQWDAALRLWVTDSAERAAEAKSAADKIDLWKMWNAKDPELSAAGLTLGQRTHRRGFGTIDAIIAPEH
jgi:hypothetical protein